KTIGSAGRPTFDLHSVPTPRALAFARATRPSTLAALPVHTSDSEVQPLERAWTEHGSPVPLTVLDSPYREIAGAMLDYLAAIHRKSRRYVVAMRIPNHVVGH